MVVNHMRMVEVDEDKYFFFDIIRFIFIFLFLLIFIITRLIAYQSKLLYSRTLWDIFLVESMSFFLCFFLKKYHEVDNYINDLKQFDSS